MLLWFVYVTCSMGFCSGVVFLGYKFPKQTQKFYDVFHPVQRLYRRNKDANI